MDFSLVTNFLSSLPADWIIFAGLIAFFVFDTMRAGPSRVIALSIALPLALFVTKSVGTAAFIGGIAADSPALETGAFIAIAAALWVAMYRIVDTHFESGNIVRSSLAAVGGACICAVVLLQLPSELIAWEFSPTFTLVFGEAYRLYWLIGAYFLLAFSRA